ncbi:uncharacterized protein LOC116118120 [Pistacia vera]|uniref:uncharacterized protein LOC116118120 n=1 Tax=Pistacia vera TaxID=55513 RepID=UPI001262E4F4|nr:uncharacterized protein LOC116118120 [Pistacia vera]
MKETPKATTTKPRSKAPAKRPNEMEESLKDSKRAKKKETGTDPGDEDQKKPGEHNRQSYELSKQLWGNESTSGVNDKKERMLLSGMAGSEEFVIKQGLDMIGGAKKAELEERWKKLQIAQLQLFVERTDLIKEQTELILEAMQLQSFVEQNNLIK